MVYGHKRKPQIDLQDSPYFVQISQVSDLVNRSVKIGMTFRQGKNEIFQVKYCPIGQKTIFNLKYFIHHLPKISLTECLWHTVLRIIRMMSLNVQNHPFDNMVATTLRQAALVGKLCRWGGVAQRCIQLCLMHIVFGQVL